MSDIDHQVHNKFKIFAGGAAGDRSLGTLGDEVTRFVADSKVAAKSIGVEYLESARRIIITLGYRDDEPAYPVALTTVSLGKTEDLASRDDFAALEKAIGAASARLSRIICHELYITEEHEFLMVFMTHQG
jgi:hypothetical protein